MTLHRLWPSTNGPSVVVSDSASYTLGTEFTVTAAGVARAVYFWRPANAPATTIGVAIYRANASGGSSTTPGSLLSSRTGIVIPANLGGWFRAELTTPVTLAVGGNPYLAAVQSNTSNFYSSTPNYWTSGAGASGIASGILRAPSSAAAVGGAGQSRFRESTSLSYANQSFNGSNYWIDVEVDDGLAPGPVVKRRSGNEFVTAGFVRRRENGVWVPASIKRY